MTTSCYDPLSDRVLELDFDAGDKTWTNGPLAFSYAVPLARNEHNRPSQSIHPGTQFQFAWDSTSLGALKTCPRKYKWTILEGWTPRTMPPPLAFGIYFHTCMETWHKLIQHGMDKTTALRRLVRLAGLLGSRIPAGDTARTKETLVRAVVWYLDQFRDDPAKCVTLSNGKPAVEYSFAFPFTSINGIQTYICGHIDRFVVFKGGLYPTDYKTTKYQLDSKFFSQFKPSNQMQIYLLAANVLPIEDTAIPTLASGLIVDGIQLGVNFCRYQRQIIHTSPEEIEEFITDTENWLNIASVFADKEQWPANEESCTKYGGCQFREICAQRPSQRPLALKTHFVQRTWDPLEAR